MARKQAPYGTISWAGKLRCSRNDHCDHTDLDIARSSRGPIAVIKHIVKWRPHYLCKDPSGESCRNGAECLTTSREDWVCEDGLKRLQSYSRDILSIVAIA